MLDTNTNANSIEVGDMVQVVLPQECETRHAPNILGVVRKVYRETENSHVSAYGVEASGEIIFYLADQIAKVENVKLHDPPSEEIANRLLEEIILDNMLLSSYECGIPWSKCGFSS